MVQASLTSLTHFRKRREEPGELHIQAMSTGMQLDGCRFQIMHSWITCCRVNTLPEKYIVEVSSGKDVLALFRRFKQRCNVSCECDCTTLYSASDLSPLLRKWVRLARLGTSYLQEWLYVWTKLQWAWWVHKVFDKAEDLWQSKRPLGTSLVPRPRGRSPGYEAILELT